MLMLITDGKDCFSLAPRKDYPWRQSRFLSTNCRFSEMWDEHELAFSQDEQIQQHFLWTALQIQPPVKRWINQILLN